MNNPEYIFIHHSLTDDSGTLSWGAIRRFHTSYVYKGNIIDKNRALHLIQEGEYVKKPWSDIGYHIGIERVYDDYEVLMGRMFNRGGAHAVGYNDKSIGICCVGNYDLMPPPEPLLERLTVVCKFLMPLYNIPIEKIKGHRDVANKTCPGKLFDLDKFKERLL